MIKIATRLLLIACLVVPFAACKKQEAAPADAAEVALVAPAKDDDAAWRTYLQEVVGRNMGTITNSPFLYYLPPESDPEFQAKYERSLEQAKNAIARGIVGGNMLAFGSSASARMADLVVASFDGVQPDTMKGVRVLFIGDAADGERVKAAVAPAGVDFVFVEAK
ncbi:hypothetical protein SAMN06296058_0663 [Pseudoxanthomonas indica]|uniref:Uncharacterized protein n=1 Tax=Pseudoxanthomonas indica TaxID=428993 RepID=A0A1T5JB33_9GAMM|nr:hypothetical protein [Pseudoxanthomonas indica]GGD57666.1 hypothetical protein GCM10007235_32390 [Pseudoxanthomonas indica]SKC48526.1 hypothetical protein SAMN06296058_0663 [Pseudoxanthomonas indica]